jgi:hypothetical protein
MASKCERVWLAMPTACTAANSPECHHGISGDIAGCRPNIESSGSRVLCGIWIDGRTSAYRGSPDGTIVFSPSNPPRRDITTSTSPVYGSAANAICVARPVDVRPASAPTAPRRPRKERRDIA